MQKFRRVGKNLAIDTETGIYYTDFTLKGRRRRRSLRTTILKTAKRLLPQVKEEETIAAHFDGESHSFLAVATKWAREYLPASVKPNTAKRYEVSVKQLKPYFKDKAIDEIGKADIGNYVSARQGAGVGNGTIRRDLSALASILDFAEGLGWREGNCARDWAGRGKTKRLKEKPYTVTIPTGAAVAQLIARCSPMFGACVRLLAETGMRQNEAVTLEWPQVDLQRREITLLKTKNSRPRVISIDPITAAWLGRLERCTNETVSEDRRRTVFQSPRGGAYRNFSSRFRAVAARHLGVGAFRCHDLRHAFAVRKLREGWRLEDLKTHLGHSSVKVTESRYLAYISQSEERREAEWLKKQESA